MNKDMIRQGVNVVILVGTLIVNGMANALPLNGQTSAEIANRLPILFVPANYVFSIWGVIYLFLIGFGIYQALPSQQENPLLRRIGYLFALSGIFNSTWLFLFHYEQFPLSMVVMVGLLLTLIAIYVRIGVGKTAVSTRDKWLVQIPFSIYLGWITVATIANAAYVLYAANWDGFGISGPIWTTIMLVVATGITFRIIIERADVAYTVVIVWAFTGIVVKQAGTPLVAVTAGVMTLIIILALVARRTLVGRQLQERLSRA